MNVNKLLETASKFLKSKCKVTSDLYRTLIIKWSLLLIITLCVPCIGTQLHMAYGWVNSIVVYVIILQCYVYHRYDKLTPFGLCVHGCVDGLVFQLSHVAIILKPGTCW